MASEKMTNPCADCKRKRTCEKNGNYFRECLRYRAWIYWNWEQFRAGFYALKSGQEAEGGAKEA